MQITPPIKVLDPHLVETAIVEAKSVDSAPAPAGQRSGEGSDSVLDHMRKDSARRSQEAAPARR
jgi:hypothetical protein